jgi:hypothetical protein
VSERVEHVAPVMAAPRAVPPLVPALLRYALICLPLLALVAVALGWVYPDEGARTAVRTSLLVAMPLQLLTFAIARLVAREQIIAAWGIGMVLRFATLGLYGFVGIAALGLVPGPALISLAVFLFVSTLVEPLFLKS